MYQLMIAIILGLASPSHHTVVKEQGSTTIIVYGDGDEDPVGGDGGHIPPIIP